MIKILYVTNRPINKALDLNYLTEFADLDDVLVLHTTESARTYLETHQIMAQEHLDMIIVDISNVEDDIRDELAKWIYFTTATYSMKNFQLSSIPLILRKELSFWRTDNLPIWYNKMFFTTSSDTVRIKIIGQAINGWMQRIGDDLDIVDLDLDLKFNEKKTNWYIDNRIDRLSVVTTDFLKNRRKLNYIWFGKNLKTFDVSFNKFEDLLKLSERRPNIRNEKEIHQCLLGIQRVLLGEFNEHSFYEQHYYFNNSRKYVEPDFTNMPYGYYQQVPEIYEVKLPNQKLVRNDKKVFYRNSTRAFNQVSLKYRGYFSDPANDQEVKDKIGHQGNEFNYTLLIGRNRDREENLEYINSTMNQRKIRLLTYDDLPENFQRLYERTMKYNLS